MQRSPGAGNQRLYMPQLYFDAHDQDDRNQIGAFFILHAGIVRVVPPA